MARMNALLAGFAIAAVAVVAAGCGSSAVVRPVPDDGEVEAAASEVVERLEARDYAAIYEESSPEFKAGNPKADFAEKMEALESVGKLLEVRRSGAPRFRDEGGARLATVPYEVGFALGEGPLELTFRGDDAGEWRLDFYSYDVTASTYDPPYPATETGADRLAHRFLFLWQNRRYDDIRRIMPLDEEAQKVEEFLSRLEPAGDLLTIERTAFGSTRRGGTVSATADYGLTFENGKGYITFTLEERGEEWAIDAVRYDVEYLKGASGS